MAKTKKQRGPKFKKRREFNREEAFPKKARKDKMAEEIALFQHMFISINKAFPDRDERVAYMEALIKGLTVGEEEDGTCSDTDVEGGEEEVGEGESGCAEHNGSEAG